MGDKVEQYKRFHKFTREQFIKDITMFDEICVRVGEKGLKIFQKIDSIKISVDNLHLLSDERLVKIHKYFWDNL